MKIGTANGLPIAERKSESFLTFNNGLLDVQERTAKNFEMISLTSVFD
jgi:hypothetical protein